MKKPEGWKRCGKWLVLTREPRCSLRWRSGWRPTSRTAAEGERVPSTNELAAFYRINPATAAKGINILADEGLLDKRRGIGMFVAAGSRARLLARRRAEFTERYVEPLLTEAARLGIDTDELIALFRERSDQRGGVAV
jgi:DNA-binding transcriptional regulator YhcF (GntR family)